ncbi:MAG TPA: tetratricopeptide repeat protein [Flavobacteriales bacterium]|nr:tetratricopeptide repeat protein [Flavobacteriales bacterium]HIO71772.1 tetratricopeptide repeat protein [Flavobacteriales bacterium]
MAKNKTQKDETIVDVVEVYSNAERYIDENQKSLSIIIIAIVCIVGGFFAYKKLYVAPKELEAQSDMYVAEQYFRKDSLNKAINGDGNYLGFLDIIDEYSVTPSGNLANYYLGICYLKLGNYQNAIEYLTAYDSDDEMVSSIARGATGDAYMELGETENALEYYLLAANNKRNDFTSPIYLMKAAMVYEELQDFEKAVEVYKDIKSNFAETKEGLEVEKYLSRAKALASN